jgi:hypothetical protein
MNKTETSSEPTLPAILVPEHKRQHALCSALNALAPIAEAPDAWKCIRHARSPILVHLLIALQAVGLSQPVSAMPWKDIAAAYLPDPQNSGNLEDKGTEGGKDSVAYPQREAAAAASVGAAVTLVVRIALADHAHNAEDPQKYAVAKDGSGSEVSQEGTRGEDLSRGVVGPAAEACRIARPLREAAQAAGKAHGLRNAAELITAALEGIVEGSGGAQERGEGRDSLVGGSECVKWEGLPEPREREGRGDGLGRTVDDSVRVEAAAALQAMAFGRSEEVRLSYRRFLMVWSEKQEPA